MPYYEYRYVQKATGKTEFEWVYVLGDPPDLNKAVDGLIKYKNVCNEQAKTKEAYLKYYPDRAITAEVSLFIINVHNKNSLTRALFHCANTECSDDQLYGTCVYTHARWVIVSEEGIHTCVAYGYKSKEDAMKHMKRWNCCRILFTSEGTEDCAIGWNKSALETIRKRAKVHFDDIKRDTPPMAYEVYMYGKPSEHSYASFCSPHALLTVI